MEYEQVILILNGAILVECVVIGLIFLLNRNFFNPVNFFIGLYLLIRSGEILSIILSVNQEFLHHAVSNIYGPLLFLASMALIDNKKSVFRYSYLLTFLPFFYTVILYGFFRNIEEFESISDFNGIVTNVSFSTIAIITISLISKKLSQDRKRNENQNPLLLLLLWLMIFALIQLLGYYTVGEVIDYEWLQKIFLLTYLVSVLLFINGLMYIGMKYPERISDIKILKKRIRSIPDGKYSYSNLEKYEAQNILARLEKFLQKDELYRKSNLTFEEVSVGIGVFPLDLSQSINQYLGITFKSYVNDMRCEKAAKLFRDADAGDWSINDVMYHVGFNSKSTFNTLFKKKFDLTPSEFKKDQVH